VSELSVLSVAELSELIDRRQISPVDLTNACLDRIDASNPAVNAFVTVQADVAREEARAAESAIVGGRRRGPLHGIPVAHKDLYWTKGLRTTAGSRIHSDLVPQEDATSVSRLRAAGMILLGKLNTQEFAYTTKNSCLVSESRDRDSPPGGSRRLRVKLAGDGACYDGTDTGGSIRHTQRRAAGLLVETFMGAPAATRLSLCG
jgi:aspartyl-tRNA(Asn)/glutamyl-tRNA(Gln) amidotransferase subunit A